MGCGGDGVRCGSRGVYLLLLLSPSLSVAIPVFIRPIRLLDSWGEGCRVDFAQNGHGHPHLLHVLQVDVIVGLVVVFIMGLAVVGVALVVVSTVALAEGNGTHSFSGLFALGGANLLTSSFLTLDLTFSCLFCLDLFGKGLHFVNGLGFMWNRPLSSFFSSLYAFIFFCKEGNDFIHLLQGLQAAVSTQCDLF